MRLRFRRRRTPPETHPLSDEDWVVVDDSSEESEGSFLPGIASAPDQDHLQSVGLGQWLSSNLLLCFPLAGENNNSESMDNEEFSLNNDDMQNTGRTSDERILMRFKYPCGLLKIFKEVIGKGAGGRVNRGVVKKSDGKIVHVAVKFANSIALSDLETEVSVYRQVGCHLNITKFYGGQVVEINSDFGVVDSFFTVLELMPCNLKTIIYDSRDFAENCRFIDFLKIFQGIACGLQHLHKNNVVHHDLKPSNILMSAGLVPKLTDFGVSKFRKSATGSLTATMRGTLAYLAPEANIGGLSNRQIPGNASKASRVDESIDVYSFGVVMLECINRCPPTEQIGGEINDVPTIIKGGLVQQVSPCSCPKPLRELIEECLRFELAKMEQHNFDRPTCKNIVVRIEDMLMQDWVNERPPRYMI